MRVAIPPDALALWRTLPEYAMPQGLHALLVVAEAPEVEVPQGLRDPLLRLAINSHAEQANLGHFTVARALNSVITQLEEGPK